MKIFIITVAVVILYSFTLVFSQDFRMAQVNNHRLRYVCEELSATGTLFYDQEKFSEGDTIFDTDEGIRTIGDQLTFLLSVDSSLAPVENSYWSKNMEYKVYFYDDSLKCKVFKNGYFEREEAFTYGQLHEDDWTSYNAVISDPMVVTTINAGPGRYRVKILDPIPDMIRSSSHVWEAKKEGTL